MIGSWPFVILFTASEIENHAARSTSGTSTVRPDFGQKIPRGRLAEMFDELTETCYEKAKHYRKFEGAESALEWEEMEELLRRIRAILREGMPPSL